LHGKSRKISKRSSLRGVRANIVVLGSPILREVDLKGMDWDWSWVCFLVASFCLDASQLLVIGDLTGSRAKIAIPGWTTKPWVKLLAHPLFSLGGAGYFGGNLVRSFWRGEYVWHGNP
jgi:hypothetical protein